MPPLPPPRAEIVEPEISLSEEPDDYAARELAALQQLIDREAALPAVDREFVPAHSPLVPTVRYRGRSPGTPPAEAVDGAAAPTTVQTLPRPTTETQEEGSAVTTASGTAPSETTALPDQWHHKASDALGLKRSRHHLTKRETVGVIVLVVLALAGIAWGILALTGNLGGRTERASSAPPAASPTDPVEPAPGEEGATDWSLSESFRQGDFILVLDSYEDGLSALAEPGSEVAENGQWVLIEITVKNAGNEEATFLPEQQVLITNQGGEYDNEPFSAFKHAEFLLGVTTIKPGGSQTGFLAFDIPIDDQPTELRFVGSVSEPPLTVPLG
ncbi:MAG: DUF4352 domain-containing protein [Bifidobacteriaceae bacterium]|nr:DUF4352 domain-containing protein [Bifidobacteriaceae bacterium]